MIDLRLDAVLLFVQLANRTRAARPSRRFVVGIDCQLARNLVEYLAAAGGSSVLVADNSVGMLPVVDIVSDSEVVVELGNAVARLRWKCRVGVALNRFAQV